MEKKFIGVDWHGPADFDRPFSELLATREGRRALDFYFYFNRRTGESRVPGAETCLASCAHCFLKVPGAEEEAISLSHAIEVAADLEAEGYGFDLMASDSLSTELLSSSGAGGSAYRISDLGQSAWSSGAPIAKPGWEERLEQAWRVGYRSLVMNGHDIAGVEVTIAGVTRAATLMKALEHLRTWNEDHPDKQFSWCFTFTLNRQNCNYATMAKIASWAAANDVRVCRFNCFADFLGKSVHAAMQPRREDIVEMYRSLARLHLEYLDYPMEFAVSEDFGASGIEHIEPYIHPDFRGQRVGMCRAGHRLFAVTPINGILTVVGCVDRMAPYLGVVVRDGETNRWTMLWDFDRLEELRQARLQGQDKGCFGGVGRNRRPEDGFNTPEMNDMLARNTSWIGFNGRPSLPIVG